MGNNYNLEQDYTTTPIEKEIYKEKELPPKTVGLGFNSLVGARDTDFPEKKSDEKKKYDDAEKKEAGERGKTAQDDENAAAAIPKTDPMAQNSPKRDFMGSNSGLSPKVDKLHVPDRENASTGNVANFPQADAKDAHPTRPAPIPATTPHAPDSVITETALPAQDAPKIHFKGANSGNDLGCDTFYIPTRENANTGNVVNFSPTTEAPARLSQWGAQIFQRLTELLQNDSVQYLLFRQTRMHAQPSDDDIALFALEQEVNQKSEHGMALARHFANWMRKKYQYQNDYHGNTNLQQQKAEKRAADNFYFNQLINSTPADDEPMPF